MEKILVANRGEIALRIVRACRDNGYRSVAIGSESDRDALHMMIADEAHILAGHTPADTYLNQQAILDIARNSGADAVHPGYGLLSENETFAEAVAAAGLVWIGPPPKAIALLGDKVRARAIAHEAQVPLLPSGGGDGVDANSLSGFISEHGLPVIIKAHNGGGGRGMRIVTTQDQADEQLAAAMREAQIAFGRSECFVERYVERARHIETQCLADRYGFIAVLSTRDCTLQRRQQKLIEEAPAPFLSEPQQAELARASRALLSKVGYVGAATCEFLLTPEGDIFFLEVNTRVQVEHPVTEEITGSDIIAQMFHIAEGGHLEEAEAPRGHAIEFRINAEDFADDFRPTPGTITGMRLPSGPGIRLDFGYEAGQSVPPFYDSLIGKIIVSGSDRTQALARARRAFAEFAVEGLPTVAALHAAVLARPEFTSPTREGFTVHTRWLDAELATLVAEARTHVPKASDRLPGGTARQSAGPQVDAVPEYRAGIKAPLSGLVAQWLVEEGDMVSVGDPVAIMESMKMEQTITAEISGSVFCLNVEAGQYIEIDADLIGLN